MAGFYFLLPTLLVIFVSFLVVRAGAIALTMTGMDARRARFQALSAFSGTGFTTREAESVVDSPLRRQIITWLMILGNAGIVTVIVSATSSLVTSKGYTLPINTFLLVVGTYLIYRFASHKGLIRRWETYIQDKLMQSRAFSGGVTEDLLHLHEGYGLVRGFVKEDSALVDSSLAECQLAEKGCLALGIERGEDWITIPKAEEAIRAGDRIVVYGPLDVAKTLFRKDEDT